MPLENGVKIMVYQQNQKTINSLLYGDAGHWRAQDSVKVP